jgi:hypothetical protein|tara:strand:+ start:1135 stop:1317 length:183 start_codon:yes stop_codon:yes gene_type:complete
MAASAMRRLEHLTGLSGAEKLKLIKVFFEEGLTVFFERTTIYNYRPATLKLNPPQGGGCI